MIGKGRATGMVAASAMVAGILLSCGSRTSALDSAGLEKGAAMGFVLKSSTLTPNDPIPRKFTCDGDDVSPPLAWDAAPAGTRSFSLVTEDPDAPGGTFVHWVLYDVPATARTLPENLSREKSLPDGSRQGRNGFGQIGYGGPCPPPGPAHRYYFRLYALDADLNLAPGASRADLDRAMKGKILAQAELMSRYGRR